MSPIMLLSVFIVLCAIVIMGAWYIFGAPDEHIDNHKDDDRWL